MKKVLLLFMLLALPVAAREYPGGKDFSKYECTKTVGGQCIQYTTCVYSRAGRCREYERCTLNRRNDDYSCTSTYGQNKYYLTVPIQNIPSGRPTQTKGVSFTYSVEEKNPHYYTPANPGGKSSFR